MRIKSIEIKNFRIFNNDGIKIDNINVPNDNDEGTGLTVFVGENGCGKTTIMDALSLPLLSYKAESFSIQDFNDISAQTTINIYSDSVFAYKGTMSNTTRYKGKGFQFKAGIRKRSNKSYLSSITVQDQLFIKADGEDKPKDNAPDLRINVNNPFSGPRFYENDILYLDKNRIFQTRKGTYNATRFDRLMEDFNYQYINSYENFADIFDADKSLKDNIFKVEEDNDIIKLRIEHKFLHEAITKFKEISGTSLSLNLIDNMAPFVNAFFADKTPNKVLLPLSQLGSGYEIVFSLLYSFYLSKQSGKQLIALIDEPELHLHPELQLKFIKFLLEISKNAQIIITTHSPLLVKQILLNNKVKIFVCKKNNENIEIKPLSDKILPYISANEVNYNAFNLPTEEFHNELYGFIESENNIKDFEQEQKQNKKTKLYINTKNNQNENISLTKYIRHQIHHPENKSNDRFSDTELEESIKIMRDFIKKQK